KPVEALGLRAADRSWEQRSPPTGEPHEAVVALDSTAEGRITLGGLRIDDEGTGIEACERLKVALGEVRDGALETIEYELEAVRRRLPDDAPLEQRVQGNQSGAVRTDSA